MSNIDLFLMAAKNLWRRKLRTSLTILGVIIGVSSIIVMLSLGFGMNQSFEDQMAEWGDLTTINVRKPWQDPSIPGQKEVALDDNAVIAFKEIPHAQAVSPILEAYGTIKIGKYQSSLPVRGIDPDSMEDFGFKTAEGRLLHSGDKLGAVYGSQIKDSFYDPNARVWREIKVDLMKDRIKLVLDGGGGYVEPGQNPPKLSEYDLKTVGILTEGNWETSYAVYMSLTEVQDLIATQQKEQGIRPERNTGYDQVNVKVDSVDNVGDVQDTIKAMGHEAYSLNDELDSFKKQSLVIQAILGGIGAISLLVAAIGITNTMIMSIYERTKEIGIMKVIGASIKDIKRLFLLESALIGFFGGIFGIAISYLISYLLNKFGSQFVGGMMMGVGGSNISIIPIWLIFAAMGFSSFIGIFSGYFPARRAMNLSALEAIRTE